MARRKKDQKSEIKEYKKSISERLEKFIPIFQRIAAGDFSVSIDIPKKEDEFTPLVTAISMVLDDLRFLDKENREKTKQLEDAKVNLEKKVEARTRELKNLTDSLEQKVKERTRELQEKIDEMEKVQKITIGRELKMIELKKEIEILKEELKKYSN